MRASSLESRVSRLPLRLRNNNNQNDNDARRMAREAAERRHEKSENRGMSKEGKKEAD